MDCGESLAVKKVYLRSICRTLSSTRAVAERKVRAVLGKGPPEERLGCKSKANSSGPPIQVLHTCLQRSPDLTLSNRCKPGATLNQLFVHTRTIKPERLV